MLNRALRRFLRLLWRLIWRGALGFVVLSVALVLLFRFVPPPGSMVMVERKVQSWVHREPITIQRQWRSWDNLSNNAKLAVIAAEDQRFPIHRGFDVVELRRAWEASRDGSRLRGPVRSASKRPRTFSYGVGAAGCAKGWKPGSPC